MDADRETRGLQYRVRYDEKFGPFIQTARQIRRRGGWRDFEDVSDPNEPYQFRENGSHGWHWSAYDAALAELVMVCRYEWECVMGDYSMLAILRIDRAELRRRIEMIAELLLSLRKKAEKS